MQSLQNMFLLAFFTTIVFSCQQPDSPSSVTREMITNDQDGIEIYNDLVSLMPGANISQNNTDSAIVLILPIMASCPSCRKKTIDSVVAHKSELLYNRYIIISAKGGYKAINGYFKEQEYTLPSIPNQLYLDSLNLCKAKNLCIDKPTFYFVKNKRAYLKVSSIPVTVKKDLHVFFSGK